MAAAINKTEITPANMELTAKGLELYFYIRHFTTFYKIMQHRVLYALSASVVLLEYTWERKKTRIFYMGTYAEIPLKGRDLTVFVFVPLIPTPVSGM